jgi:hypothetical protein
MLASLTTPDDENRSSASPDDNPRLPKLFWMALTVFAFNAVLLTASANSPSWELSMYGMDSIGHASDDKPSAFAERVRSATRQVKRAEKLVPQVDTGAVLDGIGSVGSRNLNRLLMPIPASFLSRDPRVSVGN